MSGSVVEANAGNGGAGGVKVSRLTQKQEHKLERKRQKELALMEEQQREFAAKVKAQAENRTTVTKLNPLISQEETKGAGEQCWCSRN